MAFLGKCTLSVQNVDLFLSRAVLEYLFVEVDSHYGVVEQLCTRYCIACLDMTVYPAFAAYVKKAFEILGSVTAMSPDNCGFVLLPVYQKQTTDVARIKHRRTIEDYLIKGNMSYGQEVAVLYNKPDSPARDGRPMSQVCVMSLHNSYTESSWNDSDAMTSGRVGPFPLIKVGDMLGFDEATRPSASARVEQNPG